MTTFNVEDGNTKNAFIQCAKEVYLVMENKKFMYDGIYKFAELAQIDTIITESPPSEGILNQLKKIESMFFKEEKSLIITVTLNPAIDYTIYLNHFKLGNVNSVEHAMADPGGKGINVSKVIKNLGGDGIALGFVGGENGKLLIKQLDALDIRHCFTQVQGNTRRNLKIVDGNTRETTDVNENGEMIQKDELNALIHRFKETVKKQDFVVISGSVPKGIPKDIYGTLAEIGRQAGAQVLLDTSKELLKASLSAELFLINPNIHELEEVLGTNLDTLDHIVYHTKQFVQKNIQYICLSLGAEGALLISKDYIWKADVPKVPVQSTVGAGDSLLGGLVATLQQGADIEEAFTYGIAASVAAVTKKGTKAPRLEEIESLFNQIVITQLEV
ncbi:MAG: 1-phosphofructokinase [Eubacteriales bacterium]